MRKIYSFTNDEICRVREFALKINSSNSQTRRNFGSNERSENQSASDTFEGKLAEVAFVKFAQQFGAVTSVDYDIYPEVNQIDFGQDIDRMVNLGKAVRLISRIDIKASRDYSAWLLIEYYKFWADAYVFVRVKIPQNLRDNINEITSDSTIEADISGFAYHFDVIDPKTKMPWFQFAKGEQLFNPTPILENIPPEYRENPSKMKEWIAIKKKTNEYTSINIVLRCPLNYGVPLIWLRSSNKDWTFFFNWLKASTIDIDNVLPES